MTNIEKLRIIQPDLVAEYEAMTKEQLLEACCGEVLDLHSATERVQLFMGECTNMSKTNYTLEVIKKLIKEKKEQDLAEWCSLTIEDATNKEIVNEVKVMAKKFNI